MPILRALVASFAMATLGCSSTSVAPHVDYDAATAQPTPSTWHPGTVWKFQAQLRHGKARSWTFRVSAEDAKTCVSGHWRKLELLDGSIGTAGEASYLVEGQFLWVQLAGNWCDIGHDFRGRLSESGFAGAYTASQGWTYTAPIIGHPVQ